MKIVHLMNSAMMPKAGFYVCSHVGKEGFVRLFKELIALGWKMESSIGYQQNAEMLSQILGTHVPLSMKQTIPQPGEIMLIMKLSYRTREKGARVDESDFEFWAAGYGEYSLDTLVEVNQIISRFS